MARNSDKKNEVSYFEKEVEKILSLLPERSKDILTMRFGLFGENRQTLENIGRNYGITRERVRQIVADAFRRINKNNLNVPIEYDQKIIFTINSRSGIISKKELLKKLGASNEREKNAIDFLIECSPKVRNLEIKNFVQSSLVEKDFSLKKVEEIEGIIFDLLKKRNRTISEKKLVDAVHGKGDEFSQDEIRHWLGTFDRIRNNSFGKWGIREWSEINPRNTRDKIYLVLKEIKKPLHFSKIAKVIDEEGLSKKKAHPQTVHNELIKDQRFVLIGRGIYALSEWGYVEGTVREVLEQILKERGPLSKDEIFPEIMKVRKVKKATIMINLSNSKFFIKEKNLYKAV